MRHRKTKMTLDRANGPRKALICGLATSVILYENVNTTLAKAKAVRPVVERLITAGRTNSLASRRKIAQTLTVDLAVKKVMEELGPRYAKRQGGYTRMVKLGPRKGDGAEIVQIQLVK